MRLVQVLHKFVTGALTARALCRFSHRQVRLSIASLRVSGGRLIPVPTRDPILEDESVAVTEILQM